MRRFTLAAVATSAVVSSLSGSGLRAAGFGLPAAGFRIQAQDSSPEFEVASIKRNTSGDLGNSMRSLPDGTEVMVNSPIRSFLGAAFPSESGQYIGLPDWAQTERYDITVKPPAGTARGQTQQMWRALFAERMKLVAHDETSEQPIYNLVLARSDGQLGPKLKPSSHDCIAESKAARERKEPPKPLTTDADFLDSCGLRFGAGHLIGGGMTLQMLSLQLRGLSGRVVQDRTGLTGFYTIDFTFAMPSQNPGAPGAATDPDAGPSVFTALQEQLGLKLESDKMPLQHVVIDHIERPTEN
jgi:uncharacterized protein (TIGR03435 family)